MKPLSITIAIPAHNEEKNILTVLSALEKQDVKGLVIHEVVVMCDGCSDDTARLAKDFSSSHLAIRVIEDNRRIGKIGRLNDLYANCASDIIIMFDADILITDTNLVQKLISGFNDSQVGLVGGVETPFDTKGFREHVFETWSNIWYMTRKDLRAGSAVHNHVGCISAIHRSVFEGLVIPKEIVSEDEFLFFETVKKGKKFVFMPEAKVYIRLPKTITEYCIQSARYIGTKQYIITHFGSQVEKEYSVPRSKKWYALFKSFVAHPIYTFCAVSLQVPIRFMQFKYHKKEREVLWSIAKTTK